MIFQNVSHRFNDCSCKLCARFRCRGDDLFKRNGSPALTSSTLTIDPTGGTSAAYSNITLTFGGDARGHFGTQPVNGFVEKL